MRVVLVSQVAPAAHGLTALLRELGHEPLALLGSRDGVERYGEWAEHVIGAPEGLDVIVPATRASIAPLVGLYRPDLLLCLGFPWIIPEDALSVAKLGSVNGHPSLLPRYRGPIPVAWAIRNGETDTGFTFHRMDATLDTGPILAQAPFPLGDAHSWEELEPVIVPVVSELLPAVLARVEAGDPGEAQGEGEYFSFFEPEYARIDWSRTRAEVAGQIRAWRFASGGRGGHGALADIDGDVVRVLRVSPEPVDGVARECSDGTLWIVESEPV
jgi:methionyl-tRNA formyltransferase